MIELRRRYSVVAHEDGENQLLRGYKFSNYGTGAFDVTPDPNYAVLLNVPLDSQFSYRIFGGNNYDDMCQFKLQDTNNVAFDYFSLANEFRDVKNASYVSICVLISEVDNILLGYLPDSSPEEAFIVYGINKDIIIGNHIVRYYKENGKVSINSYCLWNVPKGSATRISFLLRNAIYFYDENNKYVDYWGSSFPNERIVSVGTSVTFFRSDYYIDEINHLYIKDADTGDILWTNLNE